MKTSDFDYNLPESSIAQSPAEPRDSARLLVTDRKTGALEHSSFRKLADHLRPTDLLVLNRTRVIPARIFATKATGGRAELLLLRRRNDLEWEALAGGKGLRVGTHLHIVGGPAAEIIEILDGAQRLVRFEKPIEPFFPMVGHVPLPPYIHNKLSDPERYQTVYARDPGSAAAPTAGLHFTAKLLEGLRSSGIAVAEVTLHVGLDTFAPVAEDDPVDHKIHSEWCEISEETAKLVNTTKSAGGRVIAVGTTTVRTLESAAVVNRKSETVNPFSGPTELFILPGHDFRVVDGMITNFHLPRSTLLMLVCAFAGRERVLQTYQTAIREGYRFYSFGDAMLIL